MKVLRADEYASVPWRNGGGTTREIAAYRDPSRHDDFLWRLSIANVERPGPFSKFDGVDRTIVLVAGDGMLLRSPTDAVSVTASTPPFCFDGESEISCELLGGPTVDLNVMTRRAFFRHSVRREHFTGWLRIEANAEDTFIVSNHLLELSVRGRDTLRPLDTVAQVSPGTTLDLYADCSAEIFVVELMSK